MKSFIHDNFLLQSKYAVKLYHEYAADLPIIDYHNHLSPEAIAKNQKFDNITQLWIEGDHYKWRAMRTNGVNERYITGDASDWEKFEKWAETVPYTLRNPLFHWSHMELKRYFDIDTILGPENAREIYDACNKKLQDPMFFAQGLLEQMNVESLCTTDDPIDDLRYHKEISNSLSPLKVFPTFRPDRIITVDQPHLLKEYLKNLEDISNKKIKNINNLLDVLNDRMDYFHDNGCRLSDFGLSQIPSIDFDFEYVNIQFVAWRKGQTQMSKSAQDQFNALIIHELALGYHKRGWAQQFHLGAIRDNNTRLKKSIGADVGCDSIGDFEQSESISRFLNRLDSKNQLTKTILYNLNPRDNEVFATMIGNFQDGSVAGKMQWGSGWWFLDQKDGMEKQINTLSSMGILARFVGMLTDSRSFLSFPRHEYFRRILCNLIGQDVADGLLPDNIPQLGKMIQDICYYNAKDYFDFE